MTIDEVKKIYNDTLASESIKLSNLKKKIFRVGTLRLIIVLACILACYFLWGNGAVVTIIVLASISAFLVLLKYHNRLFKQRQYCELVIENAQNELKGIDYDFSAFDGATELIDGSHSYSLDLDLFGNHSFFQSINRTVTAYGKKRLAKNLLTPITDKEGIKGRQAAVEELAKKMDLIMHFRAIGEMNKTVPLEVESLSSKLSDTKQIGKSFWRYMPYFSAASFAIVAILLSVGVPPLLPVSFIGLWWTIMLLVSLIPIKSIKEKINYFEKNIDTLETYSKLFRIIENEDFESPQLKALQSSIRGQHMASNAIHQLKSYCTNLDQTFTVIGVLFLNPVFFWAVIYGIKIEKWINEYKKDIPVWFESLADFDSLISLATFRFNHPDYTFPEVSPTPKFEGKALGHPMLRRNTCIRNDVSIHKRPFFLVVTGANMAGKSTYLRTIGINMILACAGAPVCAEHLLFYPFHLVTNLRTSDSLADNESYFFAELKRLKMIIDRLQSGEELFIILDEILKGTNSEDKQKGSLALMKQLIHLGGNGIIATHDLVLGNLEDEYPDEVKDYRFEADITNNELTFSYKIREGIAQNMNACFLMKKMGITGL